LFVPFALNGEAGRRPAIRQTSGLRYIAICVTCRRGLRSCDYDRAVLLGEAVECFFGGVVYGCGLRSGIYGDGFDWLPGHKIGGLF
jgi:hypothetical protein